MDLRLQEKVVIITGGGKGIGSGISLELAREGAIPIILSRSAITDDFKNNMEQITKKYEFVQIDLNETAKIKDIIDTIYNQYSSIYGIVNNAGANDNIDIENYNWQDFEKSLHSNLSHYFEIVHCALPYIKQSHGSIVNIGSKTSLTGQGKTSAYAAAKGAILGLTREWAAALAKDGVRANAIIVAECWTPLYKNWIKSFGDEQQQKEQLAKIEKHIPLYKRMTTIEEIADTAVFLLSSRSSHTTGQWIHVDGGYVHLDRALN